MGIEDILMHDETVFKNLNAFDPDYVPPNYNFRDTQMEAMAFSIRPAMSGGQPSNAIVLGSPATGKTTAVRKIFELVGRNTEKIYCVYVNCQLNTTRFGIISQIHKKIFGHMPPETGIPFSRIYSKVMSHLQVEKKSLVLALDDVNYLFQTNSANKFFYDILRAYEEYPGVKTSIFAILSDLEFRYVFDKNVTSVFIPREILFPPYSFSEIESILKDRSNAGFYPGVIDDDIIEQIASYTFDYGDLRTGINILRSCGNFAEADASRMITREHFDKAIDSLVAVNVSEIIDSLSERELSLLRLVVSEGNNVQSGVLSDKFIAETGASYSTFIRVLKKLEFLRLVDAKYTGSGSVGNSREVCLRFDPDVVQL